MSEMEKNILNILEQLQQGLESRFIGQKNDYHTVDSIHAYIDSYLYEYCVRNNIKIARPEVTVCGNAVRVSWYPENISIEIGNVRAK